MHFANQLIRCKHDITLVDRPRAQTASPLSCMTDCASSKQSVCTAIQSRGCACCVVSSIVWMTAGMCMAQCAEPCRRQVDNLVFQSNLDAQSMTPGLQNHRTTLCAQVGHLNVSVCQLAQIMRPALLHETIFRTIYLIANCICLDPVSRCANSEVIMPGVSFLGHLCGVLVRPCPCAWISICTGVY